MHHPKPAANRHAAADNLGRFDAAHFNSPGK
jgi:hypothetical protein